MTPGWLSGDPPRWMIRKTTEGWTVYRRRHVGVGIHYISEAWWHSWSGAMAYIEEVSSSRR